MWPKRMLWQIFPSTLLVMLLALAAVTVMAGTLFERFYRQDIYGSLQQRAWVLENRMTLATDEKTVDPLCKQLSIKSGSRITVIHSSGRVLGDSLEDPTKMANHADRPEVRLALAGKVGKAEHFSQTLREEMLYVAVPLQSDGKVVGVVRVAQSLGDLHHTLRTIYLRLFALALITAGLSALVSLLLARHFTLPLEVMREGLKRFAAGQLDHKIPLPETVELADVTRGMNEMAGQLRERIRTVEQQRNEQQAVLTSMREGVLALDAEDRILFLNESARRQLHIDLALGAGRTLQEAVRNTEVQRLATATLQEHRDGEGEIVIRDGEQDRCLQIHTTALKSAENKVIGALLVLNDITRLRQLETVRRDFVANVSHELKTPITSVKGYVETLLDGGMHEPADLQRFLEIIGRQANRLSAIIDDLLLLSRLEENSKRVAFEKENRSIKETLETAAELCEMLARNKSIALEIQCDEALNAFFNPTLLEQAVTNLVNNAIRYSKPSTSVQIGAEATAEGVVIRVRDQGAGISREHLPRLFERFYRVDKARSREMGGTGLGLSIVKHIMQVHRGRVEVESELGKGSVFELHLPKS
jgi:two-component system, OmpR family, phosphate regulon sensor histidine kinase PhoR